MAKHLLFIFFLLIFAISSKAQVAGISGSKLNAFNAQSIGYHKLELEPLYSATYSNAVFNNKGRKYLCRPTEERQLVDRDIHLRATLSPLRNLEVGTDINFDLDSFSLGMKYVFWQKRKSAIAIISGMNFSGNKLFKWKGNTIPGPEARVSAYAIGLAFTYQFSERFSWDTDIQYQNSVSGGRSFLNDYFVNSDLGYYIFNHRLQLVGGIGYHSCSYKFKNTNAYALTMYPGVTIETGKSYIIVINGMFDFMGKNVEIYNGFSIAFTLTFN